MRSRACNLSTEACRLIRVACQWLPPKRAFSTCSERPNLPHPAHDALETLELPQATGNIRLSTFRPRIASKTSDILLYLPANPWTEPSERIAPQLFTEEPGHTVITIHFRLPQAESRENSWPTPLHDVLAAWDHITAHLLPSPGHFHIHGQAIGGTLALALAMTEGFQALPNSHRISSVRTIDAVTDWPALSLSRGEAVGTKTEAETESEDYTRSLGDLRALRARLFGPKGSNRWFDPFASPVHFLRTPVLEEVKPQPLDILAKLREKEMLWEERDDALKLLAELGLGDESPRPQSAASLRSSDSVVSRLSSQSERSEDKVPDQKIRTWQRRWPAIGIDLVPRFELCVSVDKGVLQRQNREMVNELRKALVRERTRGMKVDFSDASDEEDMTGSPVMRGTRSKGKRSEESDAVKALRREVATLIPDVEIV